MFIHDLCPRFIELLQQAGLLPPHDPQTAVPAREAGKEGCAYDTPACAQHCRRSTPRDAEARFIHYRGRNQAGAEDPTRARNVHGYRSYAFNLGDNDLHIYWVAYSSMRPANTAERTLFPEDFAHLRQRLPQLPLSEVGADAAAGFAAGLESIYHAGAIPVVDIRTDDTDKDPEACLLHGYDANGRPLCALGFPMAYNTRLCSSARNLELSPNLHAQ